MRSLSTDSGYKQSIDIDDIPQSVGISPRVSPRHNDSSPRISKFDLPSVSKNIESSSSIADDLETCSMKTNEADKADINTTVVTIEHDKLRRLRSIEFRQSRSKSKSLAPSLTFDQNRTIESVSPGILHREITLPSFICTSPIQESPTKSFEIMAENHLDAATGKENMNVKTRTHSETLSEVCNEYVILDGVEIKTDGEKIESVEQLCESVKVSDVSWV